MSILSPDEVPAQPPCLRCLLLRDSDLSDLRPESLFELLAYCINPPSHQPSSFLRMLFQYCRLEWSLKAINCLDSGNNLKEIFGQGEWSPAAGLKTWQVRESRSACTLIVTAYSAFGNHTSQKHPCHIKSDPLLIWCDFGGDSFGKRGCRTHSYAKASYLRSR